MKKTIAICVLVYLMGIFTPIAINKAHKTILEHKVIYKIRINREFINLREEIDLKSEVIRQVYKDEEFEVIKYYEGNSYNWYNVIYDDNKTGWIASGKENSWVIVENKGE